MPTDPPSYIRGAQEYSAALQNWIDGTLTDAPAGAPPPTLRSIDHYRPPRRPYVLEVDRASNVSYTGTGRRQLRISNTSAASIPIRFFRPINLTPRTLHTDTLGTTSGRTRAWVMHNLYSAAGAARHYSFSSFYYVRNDQGGTHPATTNGLTQNSHYPKAQLNDDTWELEVFRWAAHSFSDAAVTEIVTFELKIEAGPAITIDMFDSAGNPRLIFAYY